MGSISLLGKQTPQLVCLFAKSSGGRRHTLERQGQLQQTRVKVREWKVKSQSKTQLKTQIEKMSNNPYGNLSAEVQSALANLNSDDSAYQPQNAHELFKFTETSEDKSNVFLQVGGWTQPLVPGASPCLRAENGAIMFPDIYSEQSGCSVGLVLVDGLGE